jgi:hypothetical protein
VISLRDKLVAKKMANTVFAIVGVVGADGLEPPTYSV